MSYICMLGVWQGSGGERARGKERERSKVCDEGGGGDVSGDRNSVLGAHNGLP